MNAKYRSGGRIEGVKFLYNTPVKIKMENGNDKIGWIVGVELSHPEVIYTIEFEDHSPDINISESCIEAIFNSNT